jgi:hydroxymethylpyrimidine/phosphomethylpyrimidine kinase
LTIAGYDPSSGAGMTADLQVFAAHGVYGVSAITALTVQSTVGVAAVEPVAPQWLRQTLDALATDLPAQGIKIGMLGSAATVAEVASFLDVKDQVSSPTSFIPIVLDPVLTSSSGTILLQPGALELLRFELLPVVGWVTPNWAELAALTGLPVDSLATAEAAMHKLGTLHPRLSIVATGGDQARPIDLLRLPDGKITLFEGERVETTSTHGTGCAFSSALLCRLMRGDEPVEAARAAKNYVRVALRQAPRLGHGRGPLHLLWPLR